jgi:hypothetical protein
MQERVAGGGIGAQRVINATLSDLLWKEASIKAKANIAPRDRGMNKTETKFSRHLEAMKRGGEIADWRFEPLKFRLADMTTYTPDFLVIGIDGSIALVDTKAYWKKAGKVGVTEDANVKIKVVADQYPWFTFQIAWEQDGIWQLKTH